MWRKNATWTVNELERQVWTAGMIWRACSMMILRVHTGFARTGNPAAKYLHRCAC